MSYEIVNVVIYDLWN